MTNATTQTTPCRKRELTPTQYAALDQLMMGKNDRETADLIGVHRVTVTRWRLHDHLFRAQFKRQKLEIMTGSANRLRSLLPKALDCLAKHLNPRSDFCLKAVAQVFALVKAGGLNQEYLDGPEITADQYYEYVLDDDPKVAANEDSQKKTEVATGKQVSVPVPAMPVPAVPVPAVPVPAVPVPAMPVPAMPVPAVQKEEPPKEIGKQLEEEAKPIQVSSPENRAAVPDPAAPVAQIAEPRKRTGEQSVQTSDPTQPSASQDCQFPGEMQEPNADATTDPSETNSASDLNNPDAYQTFRQVVKDLKHIGEHY